MAEEVVLKIKQAEENALEIIKSANDKAKQMIRDADLKGKNNKKEIVENALKAKSQAIEQMSKKTTIECEPLILKGNEDKVKIENPSPEKFEAAVTLIVERIVNA